MEWGAESLRMGNTLVPLALFYLVYDLCYTLFHRALHHRAVYHLVHKHHHRQKVTGERGDFNA